jgi:hypothetical protein
MPNSHRSLTILKQKAIESHCQLHLEHNCHMFRDVSLFILVMCASLQSWNARYRRLLEMCSHAWMCVCMFVFLWMEHTTDLQATYYFEDAFSKLLSFSESARVGVSSLLYSPCVLDSFSLFPIWFFSSREFLTLLYTRKLAEALY